MQSGLTLMTLSHYEASLEYSEPPPRPPAPINLRAKLSRLRALVSTALGRPEGFFTQYPYTGLTEPVSEPYPEMEALCAQSAYREFLDDMSRYAVELTALDDGPTDPVLGRGMFPAIDGVATYAAIRKFRPKRIVEIGSGDSTYFLAYGVKKNGFGSVTCIDPKPRRAIEDLGVMFQARMLTAADCALADELEQNDILFIDSSHIMLPGMDVDIQFNRLFPRLNRGVLVHLHDIFLPDDYPPHWRSRHYTEQNALIGWIYSKYFELIWPGQYVLTRHAVALQAAVAGVARLDGAGSFWMRRA
jgi:predicted O-methyltransferase YrrM